MSIKVVSDKLKEIGNEIEKNSDSYNLQKLSNELKDFEAKVFLCLKPDPEILALLGDKNYFKTRPIMDSFVNSFIKTNSTKKSRSDAEIENTLLLMKNKIPIEEIKEKLPKKKPPAKKKATTKKPTEKLPLEEWPKTEEIVLREKLNDYTAKELKTVGAMYLKASEKKLKKDLLIEAILKGIRELRSISRLGT